MSYRQSIILPTGTTTQCSPGTGGHADVLVAGDRCDLWRSASSSRRGFPRPASSWIGWDFRHQYDRLHLVANNSRFPILPEHRYANLASRVLALCERRLAQDWRARFGHPLLLLETFVDPRHFHGTIYRATNWHYVGGTRGFRRTREGYGVEPGAARRVFVRPLHRQARARLSVPVLDPRYRHGAPKIMLSADHMGCLPEFFADIPDPRRGQGRRHPLSAVLAIAAGATLCGMRGYKAISLWAQDPGQKARARFRCCCRNRRYEVPSRTVIREVLVRVDPGALDRALRRYNAHHGANDEGLAIDEEARQAHILGLVGHQSQTCHARKKSAPCP